MVGKELWKVVQYIHYVHDVYNAGRLGDKNNSVGSGRRELKPVSSFFSLCLAGGLLGSITLLGLCCNLSVPAASSDADQCLPPCLLLLGPS